MSAANENTARLTQFKNKGKDATVSNKHANTAETAEIDCFLSNVTRLCFIHRL